MMTTTLGHKRHQFFETFLKMNFLGGLPNHYVCRVSCPLAYSHTFWWRLYYTIKSLVYYDDDDFRTPKTPIFWNFLKMNFSGGFKITVSVKSRVHSPIQSQFLKTLYIYPLSIWWLLSIINKYILLMIFIFLVVYNCWLNVGYLNVGYLNVGYSRRQMCSLQARTSLW